MADLLKLPAFFGPNMILQRDRPIKVWGHATPNTPVTVSLAGQSVTVNSGDDGRWKAELGPLSVGGPFELRVLSGDEEKRLTNVMMGDVWVCSGQSNMEWTISAIKGEHAPAALPAVPMMRLFTVTRNTAKQPTEDVTGSWNVASEEHARNFSAVAYYFGERLHETLGVPIGLISTAWGGTAAEAWTPADALQAEPELAHHAADLDKEVVESKPHDDPGNVGLGKGWAAVEFDDSAWPDMQLPTYWGAVGHDMNGSMWFRREVDLPQDWAQQDLRLSLGVIDDFDNTYVNGHEIGRTGSETIGWWAVERLYTIPRRFLRAGRNVIAVRVFDQWGQGGFGSQPDRMWLAPTSGVKAIMPLDGPWAYQIEHELPTISGAPAVAPTQLYNAMIHPLVGLPIKGFAWYQGESNAHAAHEYRTLLATMIRAWRSRWGQGDLPFLIVQLANFGQQDQHGVSPWAELRESQRLVSLSEPNCGLACTIDIGEENDIHPGNKKEVGRRLAAEALRVAHGMSDTDRSPTYRSHAIEGSEIKVQFDTPALSPNPSVCGFSVAGEDKVFHPATAEVRGNAVHVRSDHVTNPVAVRYGWRGHPECNLRSANGLPVMPFRSDDWDWTTQRKLQTVG